MIELVLLKVDGTGAFTEDQSGARILTVQYLTVVDVSVKPIRLRKITSI